jgi:LuxR family transcriptional regulator, maltose regulon positive regulatory protein
VTLTQLSSNALPADLIAALKDTAAAPQHLVRGRLSDQPFLMNTKFSPPPLPLTLVVRARLTNQINRRVTFIYAPSGFGKTTLLNDWQHQQRVPVAWISLGVEDNLPSSFCFTLAAALAAIDSSLDPEAHAQANSFVGANQIAAYLTTIIHQLFAKVGHFDLVLDHYQHIHSEEIDAALSRLLEILPEEVSLIRTFELLYSGVSIQRVARVYWLFLE